MRMSPTSKTAKPKLACEISADRVLAGRVEEKKSGGAQTAPAGTVTAVASEVTATKVYVNVAMPDKAEEAAKLKTALDTVREAYKDGRAEISKVPVVGVRLMEANRARSTEPAATRPPSRSSSIASMASCTRRTSRARWRNHAVRATMSGSVRNVTVISQFDPQTDSVASDMAWPRILVG